ncbi:MAG: hypothetical protein KGK10_04965 [Rhodospirillales bacterium]|nr:hypothetical protein [Rhodospirillales bacterium]
MSEEMAACDPVAGARNLLRNCAGARPGERIALLYERSEASIYGSGLVEAVVAAARESDIAVTTLEVDVLERPDAMPEDVAWVLSNADHAVFFARLGDQLRFRPMPGAARPVVSYALDTDMLGSSFARTDHRAMVALKEAVDRALYLARKIRVTCPLGTDMSGNIDRARDAKTAQTTIRRFPLSVFSPVDATRFCGRIALARFLVGTGSHYYEPYGVPLESVTLIEIGQGRILNFSGDGEDVARIRAHYAHVAGMLGIDHDIVHSWHAGIHPGCRYPFAAEVNFERWSAGAFGNPRILHFHTCGNYAPGEICWNVIDPTISLDGVAVWENGTLRPERISGGAEIMARYPDAAAIFAAPSLEIGV